MITGQWGAGERVMAWLAAALLCILASRGPAQGSGAAGREAVERQTHANIGPTGSIPSSSTNPGMSSALFVPVILSSSGRNNSFFTSELTLTNRGSREARLDYTYTAHAGGGNGRASEVLAPGQQKIASDALEYLTGLGIPIPERGNRIGTLRVEVPITADVTAVVRTTTAVVDGRAGLTYRGIAEQEGFTEAVYLCGLRQNRRDRSNVAIQHMGRLEEGTITVRATVYSGDPETSEGQVLEDRRLAPGGFYQYNGILDMAGFDNGYVKVERVEGEALFYAYGVINDQANSDGSFVFPVTASSLEGTTGQTLPVVVETSEFQSELTVTNFSEEARMLHFRFESHTVRAPDRTASFTLMPVRLEGGEQRILPDIIESLRREGVEGLGSARGSFAGPLFVTAEEGDLSGIVIGARTGSEKEAGQYSVFYTAVPVGAAFSETAWVDGLQQNGENRSNLALVNTGEVDGSDSIFSLEIYDGETGMAVKTVITKPVPARRWHQVNAILGQHAPGTTQGYVRIRKMSGINPFLAYGVINDGGAPGERSGDGAYLPAIERGDDPGTADMMDREVLKLLYHATGGPRWIHRTHWLSAAPLSDWHGVKTDASGRVTSLALEANGLSGAIPPALGQLTRLESLELGSNDLSGTIPVDLGRLTQLQVLQLRNNRLSGAIPPALSGLTYLLRLDLGWNQLTGKIPAELGRLPHLQLLALDLNQLSGGIPLELGRLTRIRWLALAINDLTGTIPPELGGLTQLESLELWRNRLTGAIPMELGQLHRLQFLGLSYNDLTGAIPPELGRLTRLQELSFRHNELSGAIPSTLQQLSQLRKLDIRDTDICVPAGAAFQAWLSTISTFLSSELVCDGTRRVLFSASDYNVKEGESVTISVHLVDQTGYPVPSVVIALTSTPRGGATSTDYSGIPERVTITTPANEGTFLVTAVEDDHFDHSETVMLGFRKPLPAGVTAGSPETATVMIHDPGTEGVTNQEVLEALYHATGGPDWKNRTNWLSELPLSEWHGVTTDGRGQVTALSLFGNGLSGTLPPALGQLTHLQTLHLQINGLGGEIPPELTGLASLQELNLAHNGLSGEIPVELGGLSQLQRLDLGLNQLTGRIPPELAGLTDLLELDLGNNQLIGEIPVELGGLTLLQVLDLGGNQLTGRIGRELAGFTQLQELDLGFNQLTGTIPAELGGLTHLQELNLRHNGLNGEIPTELGQLTQLQRLSLGSNNLSGRIPPELGGLPHLQGLTLEHNQLTGEIPTELGRLPQLLALYLNGNRLNGEIPTELGELTQLRWLLLGGNNLSGGIPPELGGLTQLFELDLGHNKLSGEIPYELTQLTTVQKLDLRFNENLIGAVPTELQELPLSTFDLMATSVCVPEDVELHEWLATIEFTTSGLTCGHSVDAMSRIDILVVHTPAARKIAGGTAEIAAHIDLMIAETNQAYRDSGVNQRVVLVAREEVEYAESGSTETDLTRLVDASDGYMDAVHAIRDQAGADLVHFIATGFRGGLADVMRAFAYTCAECGTSVFAHELGHNMGLHHDRFVTPFSRTFPYSHGYVNQQAFTNGAPESARWRTIMAYPNQCSDAGLGCNKIMRFSSPNQAYLGDPLGAPGDDRISAVNGPADAVRTLNITRHSVASWRPRASASRLTMPATVSQTRPRSRIGSNVPSSPAGSLFRAIAPNGRGATLRRVGVELDRATLRRREVSIEIGSLARVPDGGITALRLNLFDDMVLTGIIDRRTPTYSGGYALSGWLVGVPGGSVTLVVNGSVVAGTVRVPGATYRIRPSGAGRHAIMQVDPSQNPQDCKVVSRKAGPEGSEDPSSGNVFDGPIDSRSESGIQ